MVANRRGHPVMWVVPGLVALTAGLQRSVVQVSPAEAAAAEEMTPMGATMATGTTIPIDALRYRVDVAPVRLPTPREIGLRRGRKRQMK